MPEKFGQPRRPRRTRLPAHTPAHTSPHPPERAPERAPEQRCMHLPPPAAARVRVLRAGSHLHRQFGRAAQISARREFGETALVFNRNIERADEFAQRLLRHHAPAREGF